MKQLFDKLTLEYINAELVGKEFENNYLECKEKQRNNHGGLDEGDIAYFAKSLSGFANTSGGTLIFGLTAKKDKQDVDLIQSLNPIPELKRFESALREKESRIVERQVLGVEYKRIETATDKGILAVYIPQSSQLPHRSTKDWKFYIRAGGTFQPLDLNLIEDLFYRRLRPSLEFVVNRPDLQNVIVALKNNGDVTAKNVHLVFSFANGLTPTHYEIDGNTRLTSFVYQSKYQNKTGRFMVYTRSSELSIHPEAEISLITLWFDDMRAPQSGNFSFDYFIYAENMPQLKGTYVLKT